jgi:hypothetical protein
MPLEPETDYYKIRIDAIKTNFFTVLGGYKALYVDSKFPDTTTNANIALFNTCAGQVNTYKGNLDSTYVSIQTDIDTLNNTVSAIESQIGSEKVLNNNNSGLFSNIQNTNLGSKIMINDYKTAYNAQYYNNIELFIGIILMIGLSSKIFRK